jgi:uncharacterized protein YpbB/nucleoside-triphosphatase THEP1
VSSVDLYLFYTIMSTNTNSLFDIAYHYVNETSCPIFLTGKAGTGKTTFLQHVKNNCAKNIMVVAPTGVAAINAGGVTMHSFFQLPFGPYVPFVSRGFGINEQVVDRHTLLSKLRFGSQKKKAIEELDLLIIDEVSMLRSDLLDAMDTILQYVRKKKSPFGGVQVLFIGDLHQLPPVVKDDEKNVLDEHYQSPFFFHAKVFEQIQPIFIELKKIYRQKEQQFIDLLNHVRNNNLQDDDYALLDQKYDPHFIDTENKYITLCSHNYKADALNEQELGKIKSALFSYQGEIKNDFSERSLPCPMQLQFKVGSQVMFIKNDSSIEKRFYNGKLATIVQLTHDSISVKFRGEPDIYEVQKETWKNITYVIDTDKNEINEKVVGEFVHFPLKLAWAITIHKSQGLTFEHAIIDAGDSFAAGQVYVALSRCTSLNGLVLRTPISRRVLPTDTRIFAFQKIEKNEHELATQLNNEREVYEAQRILTVFDWQKMQEAFFTLQSKVMSLAKLNQDAKVLLYLKKIGEALQHQKNLIKKFNEIAHNLLHDISIHGDATLLKKRTSKAIVYFTNDILQALILPLHECLQHLLTKSNAKKILDTIIDVEQTWWSKLKNLEQLSLNGELLCAAELHKLRPTLQVDKEKVKKEKKEIGNSAKESFAYFASGKSIEEIAKLKNLALSTIEGHLCEFIRTGELGIENFLNENQLATIKYGYNKANVHSTSEIKAILEDKYSYRELKMGITYLFFIKEIEPKVISPLA